MKTKFLFVLPIKAKRIQVPRNGGISLTKIHERLYLLTTVNALKNNYYVEDNFSRE